MLNAHITLQQMGKKATSVFCDAVKISLQKNESCSPKSSQKPKEAIKSDVTDVEVSQSQFYVLIYMNLLNLSSWTR